MQRQTLPWSALTADTFRARSISFCRMWGRPDDYVFRLMQLWDATFRIGYFETRQRLKDIAGANIRKLSDVHCVPFEEGYRNVPQGGQFYTFVDDDDWFSPTLAEALTATEPAELDGLLWRAAIVGAPRWPSGVLLLPADGTCMTNNYAVTGNWLRPFDRLSQVTQHAAAVETFSSPIKHTQLDALLSASNKSPCSSVSLSRGLNGDYRPARLIELVSAYVDKMHTITPEDLAPIAWAAPETALTRELFDAVLASRRH